MVGHRDLNAVGIVKGDRLARSGKLARLPLVSALSYSWVVSVSRARDDFGAFQWDPGLLRATCFPLRAEVTAAMVEAWLMEWLEVGLVLRWKDPDGVELGVFTNFQGEPRARYHRHDLPPQLDHECRPACQKSGMRTLSQQRIFKEIQRRRPAGDPQAIREVPSLPSLPSLPSQETTTEQPPPSPPSRGGRPKTRAEIEQAVFRLVEVGNGLLGYKFFRPERRELADRLKSGETEAEIRAGFELLARELNEGST